MCKKFNAVSSVKYDNKQGIRIINSIVSRSHASDHSIIESTFDIYKNIHRPNNEIRSLILRSCVSILPYSDDLLLKRIECVIKNNDWINYQWINASMKMSMEQNESKLALAIYDHYKNKVKYNDVTFIYAVKCCVRTNDYAHGQNIISELKSSQKHIKIGIEFFNCLITFYGHFGQIKEAMNVFESIQQKDIVSINSMLKVFVDNSMHLHAMTVYKDTNRLLKNDISHVLIIKSCAKVDKGYEDGMKVIADNHLLTTDNLRLQNTLIHFYGAHSHIQEAVDVFHCIQRKKRGIQSINALMTAYLDNYSYDECIRLLNQIQTKYQMKPNVVSHIIGIKAYSAISNVSSAQKLFEETKNKTSESINCMMHAYIENNMNENALALYDKYLKQQSEISHLLALKACINLKQFEKGKQIISLLEIKSICDSNLINIIIDFYGNCGDIIKAENTFNLIKDKRKRIGTINSMMTAYLENKCYHECIQLFQSIMSQNHLTPTMITFVVALKACTKGTIYHFGQLIHNILKQGDYKDIIAHPSIQINLIYMYGKCGKLDECETLFDEYKKINYTEYSTNRDIWNAMIHSLGRNGQIDEAMNIFDRMKKESELNIDCKIYATMMNACNHCGKVKQAMELWNKMDQDVKFNKFAMCSFIDCLSRTGYLKKAYNVLLEYENAIGNVIEDPNDGQWMALMSGCHKSGDIEFGEFVFREIEKRYADKWPNHMASASVMMSNLRGSVACC